MIGLDTNVLVRYLAQDDPDQAARATRVVEQEFTEGAPGFIGIVVLVGEFGDRPRFQSVNRH